MNQVQQPYPHLNISDYSEMFKIDGRFRCSGCRRSRKFFCYSCGLSVSNVELPPKVKLPFDIDIIKHKQEVDGKSTSSHAKILTNDQVNIYIYPEIPDYQESVEDVILIFVSPDAVDVKSLLQGHRKFKLKNNYGLEKGQLMGTLLKKNLSEIKVEEETEEKEQTEINYTLESLPFKKAVFVDSTWNQCRRIYKDPRVQCMNSVVLQNRRTIFWRKQKDVPDWFLATVEAIHQFAMEVHVQAWGIDKNYFDNCLQDFKLYSTSWIPDDKIIDTTNNDDKKLIAPYNGQYDNLLYFYSFIYSLIHSLDDPNQCLRSYDE